MNKFIKFFFILFTLLFGTSAQARLEFDTPKNNVKIYGPYVKYNILKKPYSLGRFQFDINDIRIEKKINDNNLQLYILWPRFLMGFGHIEIITKKEQVLLTESFSEEMTGKDGKFGRYALKDSSSSLLRALEEPFQICLEQVFENSNVKACSNFFKHESDEFIIHHFGKNKAFSKLNNQKVPKNAQISLPSNQKNITLELKFQSGFNIKIKDLVRQFNVKNLMIDPLEKRIGIVDGKGSVRPTELTVKDRLFSFIKEKNYFKNRYEGSKDWPLDLEDAQMEFAPYLTGASIQLYGLILPHAPPSFEFKLDKNIAIATYDKSVKLTGSKTKTETLAAKQKNELFIHDNETTFLWNFSTPNKGEINKRYLSLQRKGQDYFFSKRIFRAHSSSVSASAGLSTTATLDIVPGYNLSLEHWFERIWGNGTLSFQRWGVSANLYQTIQNFKPSKNFPEKISVSPTNIDLLYRFSPGVRPVQRTFGLGLRYLNFQLSRSVSSNIETPLLGIGGFWQTAPQKLVDDIFNIIPFFRYPKWMELSLFYYPVTMGDVNLGFSFSWQAKGKMFFSKQWYLETSFNVNAISFKKTTNGRTDAFGIGTAHGTFGIGYLF